MTVTKLCAVAKTNTALFNNLLVSGRVQHWGDRTSEEFAVRFGLFAALKAAGFLTPDAVAYAEALAAREKLPRWFIRNPLDGEEAFFSSEKFGSQTLDGLRSLVAGGAGRQMIGDDAPDLELDTPEPADTLTALDLHAIRDRMMALFK